MGLAKKKKVEKMSKEELVREELEKDFAEVEVRRYNQVSIRLRITDEKFRGLTFDEREREVHRSISRLPSDIQADITMLILAAPGEKVNPLLNYEFDNPSPDRL